MTVSPNGRMIAISYDKNTVTNGVLQADRKEQIALVNAETGTLFQPIFNKIMRETGPATQNCNFPLCSDYCMLHGLGLDGQENSDLQ